MSLAVRTDAGLWAQGGATVAGLERAKPPLGPCCWLDVPRQGGPGAAKGPPWTRARPRSARLRRTKASLAGRGLQEAPFAMIMMGAIVSQAWPELGRSLAEAWGGGGLGRGAKTASPWLQLLQDLALRASRCRPRAAGGHRPQPVEGGSLVHCVQRNARDSRDPSAFPGFHHFFNCSPKGSVCPKILRNLRWVLEKILLIR